MEVSWLRCCRFILKVSLPVMPLYFSLGGLSPPTGSVSAHSRAPACLRVAAVINEAKRTFEPPSRGERRLVSHSNWEHARIKTKKQQQDFTADSNFVEFNRRAGWGLKKKKEKKKEPKLFFLNTVRMQRKN